jgi:hypothetical protein
MGTAGSLWRHGPLRLVTEVRLAQVAKWSVIGGGEGFFDVLIIRVVPLARTCGMRVLLNCVRWRSEFSNSVSWASCAMSCMLLRLWVGKARLAPMRFAWNSDKDEEALSTLRERNLLSGCETTITVRTRSPALNIVGPELR